MTITGDVRGRGEPTAQGDDYGDGANPTTAAADGQHKPRRIRRPSKFASVLETLLRRGEAGMNCFQSVAWCHDYTLRSTIASLRRYYGFTFLKREETVPGHAGSTVHCVRYSLTPQDRDLAVALLGDSDIREAA